MGKQFIEALSRKSMEELQNIPKSDLHNHAGRGGNKRYLEAGLNVKIESPNQPFDSL